MRRLSINLIIALALVSPAALAQAQAQSRKKVRTVESVPTVVSEASAPDSPQKSVAIVKAAEVYKSSLRQLLAARETEAAQAGERMDKIRELYKDGYISRVQLEESERELIEIRHKVEETRKQLAETDVLVVESMAETDSNSITEFETMPTGRGALKKVAYIRYKGTGDWSVSDIGKIEEFFRAKFKRALPVAALGQSETHSRWGFDHRNAVDVGLNPDTVEGRALMNYLSSQGISFMAFRRAVPGSSTGPHIHIGNTSQKLTTR